MAAAFVGMLSTPPTCRLKVPLIERVAELCQGQYEREPSADDEADSACDQAERDPRLQHVMVAFPRQQPACGPDGEGNEQHQCLGEGSGAEVAVGRPRALVRRAGVREHKGRDQERQYQEWANDAPG